MKTLFIQTGALFGFLSVAIGAFGAHALKATLEASQRSDTFETAVKYMFYHSLALVLIGILYKDFPVKWLEISGFSMLIGILLFSGSLFALCLTGIKTFGAVTPIGGLAFLVGWFGIFWAIYSTSAS